MSEQTSGEVLHIHVAPRDGDPLERLDTVEALAGRGLQGDRYVDRSPSHNITLVEDEKLRAACERIGVAYEPGCSRRNVTVRGIALDAFVGKQLRIGDVVIEGHELCEPCQRMETAIGPGAMSTLVHQGGLRGRIVRGGRIAVGDRVTAVTGDPADASS